MKSVRIRSLSVCVTTLLATSMGLAQEPVSAPPAFPTSAAELSPTTSSPPSAVSLFETADPFAPPIKAPASLGSAPTQRQDEPVANVLNAHITQSSAPGGQQELPQLRAPMPLAAPLPSESVPILAIQRDPNVIQVQNTQPAQNEPGQAAFGQPPLMPIEPLEENPFPADEHLRTDPPAASLFDVEKPVPTPEIPPVEAKIPSIDSLQPSEAPQLTDPGPFGQPQPFQQTTNRQVPAERPAPLNWNQSPPAQTVYNPPAAEPSLLKQPSVQETVHEVQPGENYWTISRQHYGTASYFAALAEYNRNRIPRPDRMKPGMFVLVPDSKVLEQRYPNVAGIADMHPSPESLEPSGYFVSPNGQPMYRIGKGDTLTDIAETHLGRTARWTQIVGMNRDILRDGNSLKIGMVLRLPHDASQVALAPAGETIR